MTKREKADVLASLTDAEAGAIQAVSEVEILRRERDGLRATVIIAAMRTQGSDANLYAVLLDALGGTCPRVFTEAEVLAVLNARRQRAQQIAEANKDDDPDRNTYHRGSMSMAENVAMDLGLKLD